MAVLDGKTLCHKVSYSIHAQSNLYTYLSLEVDPIQHPLAIQHPRRSAVLAYQSLRNYEMLTDSYPGGVRGPNVI